MVLKMSRVVKIVLVLMASLVQAYYYPDNATTPAVRQLLEFKQQHPRPIGLLTIDSGSPVDLRDTVSLNSDLLRDDFFLDLQTHADGQKVPERIVHPKGFSTWGFFEVTNDVSKYTSADVFNGIGKKTPVLARFSVGTSERGISDLRRDFKGMSVKLYTKHGNLDFINLHPQIFMYNDPNDFTMVTRMVLRNPKTALYDINIFFDLCTLKPVFMPNLLWFFSDYGIPESYRFADYFPAHVYELINKHGDRWYVKFNFRTEQGLRNLTTEQVQAIQGVDPDYYIRDMYNSLETKNYPSWRLDMDVMSLQDIQNVYYDPFDMTKFWKNGTFHTVTIGRLLITEMSDNHFRDEEQTAFNPANLVPGIPGPIDQAFRARRFAYRDAQNYRVGRNHNKVGVNAPVFHSKNYNRDGHPPVLKNMKDAPTFYPNSFNGPVPMVDDLRPKEYLQVLHSNAADLGESAYFYNEYLKDDGARQRLAENLAAPLLNEVIEPAKGRTLRYFKLISEDLYERVVSSMEALVANATKTKDASFDSKRQFNM